MSSKPKPKTAEQREQQARRMAILNVPMRQILKLPFRTPLSKTLMLAYLTGRRSGRRYEIPLSYVRDGDTLLTPGGGRWKYNLVDGQPQRLKIAGRTITATAERVRDEDEVDRLLEVMVAADSRVLGFAGIGRDAAGRIDREQLRPALKHGFCIVRWHPAEGLRR